jgi:hypothetical protein
MSNFGHSLDRLDQRHYGAGTAWPPLLLEHVVNLDGSCRAVIATHLISQPQELSVMETTG